MTPREAYDIFTSNYNQDTREHLPLFRSAGGNILEIGVFRGASTSAFLCGVEDNGGHVYGVDIDPICGEIFAKGHPRWTFICRDSKDSEGVIKELPSGITLDVLFVDGDHGLHGCLNDLRSYAPLVKSGGVVFIHDIYHPMFPEVEAACRIFCAERGLAFDGERTGSWGLGVIRIPDGGMDARSFNLYV